MSDTARLSIAWVALLVLTGVSFGVSSLHLTGSGMAVALTIAVIKATIVVLVFMELLREPVSVRIAFVAALVMVSLLIFFVVADVVMQAPSPLPSSVVASP